MWHLVNGYFQDSSLNKFKFLRHGFSTKLIDDARSREALRHICGDFNILLEDMVIGRQVHGTCVRVISARDEISSGESDGFITNLNRIALGVLTADCAPIFLAAPVYRVIGLLHCGWRGCIKGILSCAVKILKHRFGVHPRDLIVSVGPHIRPCCYRVGWGVARHFPFRRQKRGGGWHIDLGGAIALQSRRLGVLARNIQVCRMCSVHNEDLFFSYRRDKTKKRMLAFFSLRSEI